MSKGGYLKYVLHRNYITTIIIIQILGFVLYPTFGSADLPSGTDNIIVIDEHINYPMAVAVDSEGRIYVADRANHRIHVYNHEGKWEKQIGDEKINGKLLSRPSGVFIDESLGRGSPRIIVSDYGNHRIVIFDANGKTIKVISEKGKERGKLKHPYGIYENTNSEIIIADAGNHRVQVFNPENESCLKVLSHYEVDGIRYSFSNPRAVAVDISDNLFICDSNNHKIVIFDSAFKYKDNFGKYGSGPGEFRFPQGIALAPDTGNIFVTDMQNHRIQIFNNKGKRIGHYGSKGNKPGQFFNPNGIVVDSFGRLIVADSGNYRVQIIPKLQRRINIFWHIIFVCIGGVIGSLPKWTRKDWYKHVIAGILEGAFFYFILLYIIFGIVLQKVDIDIFQEPWYTELWWFWTLIITGIGSYLGIVEAIGVVSKIKDWLGF